MIKLHGEEEVVEEASSEPRNLHFEFRGTGSAQSALPGEREKQKVLGVNLVWHARQLLIKGANAALAPSVLLPSLVAELRSPLSWGLHLAKTNRYRSSEAAATQSFDLLSNCLWKCAFQSESNEDRHIGYFTVL